MQTTTSRPASGTESPQRRGIAQAPWKPSVVKVGDRISGPCVTMGSKREGKVLAVNGPFREDCGGYRYEIATDDGRKSIVFGEFIIGEPDQNRTEGRTGLDGQPLTDDEHRAMHHRADGTCVFDECPLAGTENRDAAPAPITSWTTANVQRHLDLHRSLLARKGRDRTPTRRYRQLVILQRDQLQAELDRRATEHVEARSLRDGDVIVNSTDGTEIPVLLAALYGGLIMIWTSTVNGFSLSPSVTVEIKRRNGGA